jgi:hypothetical protein
MTGDGELKEMQTISTLRGFYGKSTVQSYKWRHPENFSMQNVDMTIAFIQLIKLWQAGPGAACFDAGKRPRNFAIEPGGRWCSPNQFR